MRRLGQQGAFAAMGALVVLALIALFGPDLASAPAAAPTVQPPTASPTAVASTATPTASATPATTASGDAAAMLAAHNALRVAAGAPALRADPRVTTAAQRHAEYLSLNSTGGHEETAGRPGFTGVSVRDRLLAQGLGGATASEVATSVSGSEAVASLWVMPYHRLGLMHPHAVAAGWGSAGSGGRTVTVGVLVYDFASSAPDVVRSPASGETRVPREWDGREDVDVAPGAQRPLGYPVMAVYSRARAVTVRASILTAGGRAVDHVVAPQIYERDYVAIVPLRPLSPGTRYRVRLELTVAGIDVTDEWELETGP